MFCGGGVFDSEFDRDYWKMDECRFGGFRGQFQYFPPCGWLRYGLNVKSRYPPGPWLDRGDGPGVWAVAYHGTSFNTDVLQGIAQKGLKAGFGAVWGKGVYCSPNPKVAESYARGRMSGDVVKLANGHRLQVMFMCRVNIDKIHFCENRHGACAELDEGDWTMHYVQSDVPGGDSHYWVVPTEKRNSTDLIRPYGMLVREVDDSGSPIDPAGNRRDVYAYDGWAQGEHEKWKVWFRDHVKKCREDAWGQAPAPVVDTKKPPIDAPGPAGPAPAPKSRRRHTKPPAPDPVPPGPDPVPDEPLPEAGDLSRMFSEICDRIVDRIRDYH